MKTRRPTRSEMETMVSYLPRLSASGFSPVEGWEGGTENPDGGITMPFPRYKPIVKEFFRTASAECWRDYDYKPAEAGQKLLNEEYLGKASLDQIKEMLTFCVRGERFSDGFWGSMIEDGHVRRLLERIQELNNAEP